MSPIAARDHRKHPGSYHHDLPKLLYYTNHNSEAFTDCRVLLHNNSYQTIRIDHGGIFDEIGFESFSSIQQMLNLSLPRCDVVEPADWTFASLGTHPAIGMPYLYGATRNNRQSIQSTWHSTIIPLEDLDFYVADRADIPDFSVGNSGNVSPVLFNGEVCIAKLDKWNTKLYSTETQIYSKLEGENIAPEFLGHIAEGDLVVGFLLRAVSGRKAMSSDLSVCRDALGRFHRLGFLQGGVQPPNFIISENEGGTKAWLVGFH